MLRWVFAIALVSVVSGPVAAQPPTAPEVLPLTVLDPVARKPAGPMSPADVARERDAAIKALKEELTAFEPSAVTARQVDGRWQVRTTTEVLKDFGSDRSSALEAAGLIQDLRVNQMGRVNGSSPPFEYWLTDGKPPRVLNSRAIVLPISSRAIHAEQVAGTWAVTDGAKGLYDFGADADAAKHAAAVYWKYGFNQVGVIGSPRPIMFFPLTDRWQAERDKSAPVMMPSPLSVLNDVNKTSLLLPGNRYAGPKHPVDPEKLDVVRNKTGESILVQGDEVLARFGGSEIDARNAMRALRDARVTEVARVGSTGFPLFLSSGQPIHGEPLGATRMSIRADRLKTQKIRETWWVTEDNRPLLEAGTRDDAELLATVIKTFDLKAVCTFGRPETGGLRLLTTGR